MCSARGVCCASEGRVLADDETSAVCCSGQTRNGTSGPYCCATAGERVISEDRCCEGLEYVPRDGRGECREPCPPGCHANPEYVVGGEQCICPPGGGGGVEPHPQPCTPCTDPDAADCRTYRVYNEGYFGEFVVGKGCVPLTFYAPDEKTAEECARQLAAAQGLSQNWAYVVEEGDLGCLR
jgi:hypothetical protein